jgi:hypothetical protein
MIGLGIQFKKNCLLSFLFLYAHIAMHISVLDEQGVFIIFVVVKQ